MKIRSGKNKVKKRSGKKMATNERQKPEKIKDYKIPFEHLHENIKADIKKIKEGRRIRLLGTTLAVPVTAMALSAGEPPIFGTVGIATGLMANAGMKLRAKTLEKKLRDETDERRIIAFRHLGTNDWPALKEKYPLAFVNITGDLVLTTRERLLKRLGRIRMTLQK